MKYKGSFVIEYKLRAITGLRVGGSREEFDIGGTDNPVIKVPVEIPEFYEDGSPLPKGAPYIPGSSIKGKMRSLLEWVYGNVERMYKKYDDIDKAGKPCDCGECEICKVFGTGDAGTLNNLAKQGKKLPGPPRAKFFDAYPTKDTLDRLEKVLGKGLFTEIKTENQINRITSKANPRKVERVPAGAEFEGRIVFDCYGEDDHELIPIIFQGMKKLEDNFLGGYGSRGSGRIEFKEIRIIWKPADFYKGLAGEHKMELLKSVDEVLLKLEEIKKLCSSE
ncbi:type III-A CRISPR-associated RAMP protein Csm3 [Aquifex sp.]